MLIQSLGGDTMSERRRAYGEVRDLVEQKGGTMRFQREGYRYGAWIISLNGKQAIVEAQGNQTLPELDRMYVPKMANPKTWHDYTHELIPEAAEALSMLLK